MIFTKISGVLEGIVSTILYMWWDQEVNIISKDMEVVMLIRKNCWCKELNEGAGNMVSPPYFNIITGLEWSINPNPNLSIKNVPTKEELTVAIVL